MGQKAKIKHRRRYPIHRYLSENQTEDYALHVYIPKCRSTKITGACLCSRRRLCFFKWYDGPRRLSREKERVVELKKQFDSIQEELRKAALEIQEIGVKYVNTPSYDDTDVFVDEFEAKVAEGNAIIERWIPIGTELYDLETELNGKADEVLTSFVHKYMLRSFDDCQYERTYQLAKKLLLNNPKNQPARILFARSSLLTNRYGKATSDSIIAMQEFFQKEDTISAPESMIINNLYALKTVFDNELKIQSKEAEVDDLPRVKFKTSKGDFVVELFENEAPDTVGNFISLVESKHYDGLLFDTVIDKTAVQTGVFDENEKSRDIGYKIYDEFDVPNARNIFTGSLVMVANEPNTGNSRFFVSVVPIPTLNGKQTVFGRVISGMDNVNKINKTFTIEEQKQIPIADAKFDKIISATVLRKRDHKYEPRKFVPE